MACVALASLISTIELEFLQPIPRMRLPLHDQAPKILVILERICSLQAFLDISRGGGGTINKDLEIKIRDFALKAEDDIEIHLRSFLLARGKEFQEKASQELLQTLQEAAEKATELLNIFDDTGNEADDDEDTETQPSIHWRKHASQSSSRRSPELVGRMVGRSSDLRDIIYLLTHNLDDILYDRIKIISIVGMEGIGKTSLAKKIYGDPRVENHFEVRGWIAMPQEYNKSQILRLLLQSISPAAENQIEKGSPPEKLVEQVSRLLHNRRYLIVLDNIQDQRALNDIEICFFSGAAGSSILLTTGNFNLRLDNFFFRHNYTHVMTLLDMNESWDLFCNTISLKECMVREFEQIKSDVLEICDGLPFSIVTIAKRLSKCNNILKGWEKIKKEIESLGILDHNVLTFHYNQLSEHLKVCFLYLGVFPKRKEIPVKKLIGLWITEGFLEHEELEDQGYAYLRELIDRSLVLICNWSSDGKIKTCRMHSALHSFCVIEAQKEGIFCAVNTLQHQGLSLNEFANSCRWLSLCKHSFDYYVLFSTNNPRSIFFFDDNPEVFVPFKLLRVLAFVPSQFLQRVSMHLGDLVFLRYLSIKQRFEGLGSIVSLLPKLQTLIVSSDEPQIGAPTIHLPSKIWELPRLIHLELGDMYSVDPPSVVKRTLQTLSWVSPTQCGIEAFPKLRKLKILYKDDLGLEHTHESSTNPIILDNFECLKQLQSLKISVSVGCTVIHTEQFMYPLQLKKLKLSGTNLSQRDLTIIGTLPELKVLKLENAFQGRAWEVVKGGFRRLKFLLLEDKKLEQLFVNEESFKNLERLVLRVCYYLEEIPPEFADIPALQSIELDRCNPSVVISAKWIRDNWICKYGKIELKIHKPEDEPPSHHLRELTIDFAKELQIGTSTTDFPIRISELPQLRHLELTDVYIVDPPSVVEGKLKTLSLVVPSHCRKKVYFSFPNIRKLNIFYKKPHRNRPSRNPIILDNLNYLQRLESLTISILVGCTTVAFSKRIMFPSKLKKLMLSGTILSRRDLMAISGMRWLKVLKLENVLLGRVWKVSRGEFPNLRFLFLEDKKLKQLKIDREYALPHLEILILRYCYYLEEIPEILTLKVIELDRCNSSVVASAKWIRDELLELGCNEIELTIDGTIYGECHKLKQRSL